MLGACAWWVSRGEFNHGWVWLQWGTGKHKPVGVSTYGGQRYINIMRTEFSSQELRRFKMYADHLRDGNNCLHERPVSALTWI